MADAHQNFAVSLVATAPSPATTGTSLVVTTGEGTRFPTVPFNVTIGPANTLLTPANTEIVRVTAISTDTLTILRNANFSADDPDKGGTARTIVVGDQIAATVTERTLRDLERPLQTALKIGSITFFGHSYLAGTTQGDSGVANVYQESMASRLMGMLGIHEQNAIHLAQAGSFVAVSVSAYGSLFSGWAGALQFIWPNNATPINAQNDVVFADPINASMNGAMALVTGHNDLLYTCSNSGTYLPTNAAFNDEIADVNLRAAKQAFRTIISRFRAGAVYCMVYPAGGGALAYDSSIALNLGTWNGAVAGVTANSGAGVDFTNDYTAPNGGFTITIPANFTGGWVAVTVIGQAAGVSSLTATAAAAATTLAIANRDMFPATAPFPIRVLADGTNAAEDLLVTATGAGAGNFTVQAIGGGGTAVQHLSGAVVRSMRNAHRVDWSGTADCEGGVTPSGFATQDGTGFTYISGQGMIGKTVSVTTRFRLKADAAGKTIIGTAGNRFNTADTNANMILDSWWIEDTDPPPIVLTNIQDFNIASAILPETASIGQKPITTYIPNWNAMITAIAAEFTDGFVRVADVWTPFHERNGTTAAITNVATAVTFTPYSTSFTPKKGMAMTWGGGANSPTKGEAVIISDVPTWNSGPGTWTFSVTRASFGTTAVAHNAADWFGAADWMYTGMGTATSPYDMIHVNSLGHAVFAEHMYREFALMPVPAAYQIASVSGNWGQQAQQIVMGVPDDHLIYTPTNVALGTGLLVNGTQWALPIYIPKLCVAVQVGVRISTVGSAGSLVRCGIYLPDRTHAKPGRLLNDFGTVVGTGAGQEIGPTGYQVLRPGWYWLSGAGQGAPATHVTCRTFAVNSQPVNIPAPTGTMPASNNAGVLGYLLSGGGVTGALADFGTPVASLASATFPHMFLRLRALNFA